MDNVIPQSFKMISNTKCIMDFTVIIINFINIIINSINPINSIIILPSICPQGLCKCLLTAEQKDGYSHNDLKRSVSHSLSLFPSYMKLLFYCDLEYLYNSSKKPIVLFKFTF